MLRTIVDSRVISVGELPYQEPPPPQIAGERVANALAARGIAAEILVYERRPGWKQLSRLGDLVDIEERLSLTNSPSKSGGGVCLQRGHTGS